LTTTVVSAALQSQLNLTSIRWRSPKNACCRQRTARQPFLAHNPARPGVSFDQSSNCSRQDEKRVRQVYSTVEGVQRVICQAVDRPCPAPPSPAPHPRLSVYPPVVYNQTTLPVVRRHPSRAKQPRPRERSPVASDGCRHCFAPSARTHR